MVNQKNNGKLFQASFFLMFTLVLFPSNTKSIVIGFFSLTMLILIFIEKLRFDLRFFILNAAIYLTLLLSVLYSSDLNNSLNKLGTMSSLIIFPFLFSFFTKEGFLVSKLKNLKNFLLSYVLAVLMLNIIFFLIFWLGEFTFFESIKHYIFLIDNKLGKYNIHSIYMSMHICISIFFSLYILTKSTVKKFNTFLIIIILLQLFFLLVLNKKGPILSLIAIVTFYLVVKGNLKKLSIFFLMIFFLFLILFNNTRRREQFKELFNIEDINEADITSTNIRFSIYKYAVESFNEQPIFGYGIGDSKNELLTKYKSTYLYENRYNTHNQYLSFLLSVGIIGLTLIVCSLYLILKRGFENANYLFIIILLFYLTEMLFENILERENGVIFYSFFVCLLQIMNNDEDIL